MNRIRVPRSPDAITPGWLTATLRHTGAIRPDTSVAGVEVSDPGSEQSYAGTVVRLRVEYDRGSEPGPRAIIAKFPAREPHIRALFRTIYRNEVLFYRHLAETISLAVPRCYAAMLGRRQSLLLLEDLSDVAMLTDHDRGCTIEQAQLAVARLARLHAAWWNAAELQETCWLSNYTTGSVKNWLIYAAAWLPFQRRLGDVTPPATRRLVRNLWRYRAELQALERGRPISLQHGDYRLANLAFTDDDVYAFDWQAVRAGPPLFDLAWFMMTSLTVDQRRAGEDTLLDSYLTELSGSGIRGYSRDELYFDYRLGLLMTLPQIMVVGAFLRIDPGRRDLLGELLRRFDALRADHELERLLGA